MKEEGPLCVIQVMRPWRLHPFPWGAPISEAISHPETQNHVPRKDAQHQGWPQMSAGQLEGHQEDPRPRWSQILLHSPSRLSQPEVVCGDSREGAGLFWNCLREAPQAPPPTPPNTPLVLELSSPQWKLCTHHSTLL